MDALRFLSLYPSLVGEDSFWQFFSALKISEQFEISLYHARKLIKSLRDAGIVRRVGNQYILLQDGVTMAYMLSEKREGMLVK